MHMDKIVDKIASLGIPGLVSLVALAAFGLATATTAIVSLVTVVGPAAVPAFAVVIYMAMVTKGLDEETVEKIFKAVVKKLHEKGISKETIRKTVMMYPISRALKNKVLEYLDRMGEDAESVGCKTASLSN